MGNSTTTRAVRRAHGGPTVDDVIDRLLPAAEEGTVHDARGRPLADEAVRELHWSLAGYVRESLGPVEVAKVRSRELADLIARLEDAGVSRRRRHQVADSLWTLFDYAGERGLVDANPAKPLMLTNDPIPQSASSERAMGRALDLATAGFAVVAAGLLLETLVT